jgi:hypothetical protein
MKIKLAFFSLAAKLITLYSKKKNNKKKKRNLYQWNQTSGRQSVVAVATGKDVKTIVRLRRK